MIAIILHKHKIWQVKIQHNNKQYNKMMEKAAKHYKILFIIANILHNNNKNNKI